MQIVIAEADIATSQVWGVDNVLITEPGNRDFGIEVYKVVTNTAAFSSPDKLGKVRDPIQLVVEVIDPDSPEVALRVKRALYARMVEELKREYTLAQLEVENKAHEMLQAIDKGNSALQAATEAVAKAKARRNAAASHLESMGV